ncbi:50S ribosomal protein L17 [Geoalkalibacter sp.]|uniref:50S ribosomal protein L17 n=1 Tax=Geoalkalibacter sp. TaxID=3041440 RepID=UPI003FA5494F
MRHNKAGRTLGRNSSHRRAMLRNMVTSLLDHDRITTTDARAKELRKLADKMITLGKRGDLHARRQALQVIQDKKVVAKLFDRIAPRYQERPGGYTRIIKLGARAGDNASLAIIELVEEEFTPRPRKAAPAVAALGAPVAASIAAEAGSVEDLPAEGVIEAGEAESEEKKDA